LVEAGLEIPYSIEVFDHAMQKNFKESVAVALDVRSYRVKIVINVAAPHARRLLVHGCEVFLSVRVPGGDEATAGPSYFRGTHLGAGQHAAQTKGFECITELCGGGAHSPEALRSRQVPRQRRLRQLPQQLHLACRERRDQSVLV
jgi:hypothetical protein